MHNQNRVPEGLQQDHNGQLYMSAGSDAIVLPASTKPYTFTLAHTFDVVPPANPIARSCLSGCSVCCPT